MSCGSDNSKLYAEMGQFVLGVYSITYVKNIGGYSPPSGSTSYVPFGKIQTNDICKFCNAKRNVTNWVNITVNATKECPTIDGNIGSYSQMGYYCDVCYSKIEPLVLKSYEDSRKEQQKGCIVL